MKNTLEKFKELEYGLCLLDPPTGNGKTYFSVQVIKEMIETGFSKKKKVFFITTNIKNLPEEDLKDTLGEQLFNEKVLVIRSNLDSVRMAWKNIEIPNDFPRGIYFKMDEYIRYLDKLEGSKSINQTLIKSTTDQLRELESEFRRSVEYYFASKFKKNSYEEKINILKDTTSKYYWIGQLYPSVFIYEKDVCLLTVDKFLRKNATIIEPSKTFFQIIENNKSMIFIDEFDATKDTLRKNILNNNKSTNSITTFKGIVNKGQTHILSEKLEKAFTEGVNEKYGKTFQDFLKKGQKIINDFSLNYSYKTVGLTSINSNNFLFKDEFITSILDQNKDFVTLEKNDEKRSVEIFLETKEEKEKRIASKLNDFEELNIKQLMQKVDGFLGEFKEILLQWAIKYAILENKIRMNSNESGDSFNVLKAEETILNTFEFSSDDKNVILSEHSRGIFVRSKGAPELQTYYTRGFSIKEFIDSDSHNEHTEFNEKRLTDTPEKIMLYLAQKANIVGISATGTLKSPISNYDIDFLKEHLGDHFYPILEEDKKQLTIELNERWKAYEDGKITIHSKIIKGASDIPGGWKEYLGDIFNLKGYYNLVVGELQNIYETLMIQGEDPRYTIDCYCQIIEVMKGFVNNEDLQTLLSLTSKLPKNNDLEWDIAVLKKLLYCVAKDSGIANIDENSLVVLTSRNFEENKKKLIKRMKTGEKIFIMSSYQTLGAGQNLQYPIPKYKRCVCLANGQNKKDKRFTHKDIDAIYLGPVTNIVSNVSKHQMTLEEKLVAIMQIEELYESNELSQKDKNILIKYVLKPSSIDYTEIAHIKLYEKQCVKTAVFKTVMQAIGRINRTFMKNPNIYIYINAQTLGRMQVKNLENIYLIPEMKKIIECYTSDLLPDEITNSIKLKAIKVSSRGKRYIMRLLSQNWTKEDMLLWENWRNVALQYPCLSTEKYMTLKSSQFMFITSNKKINKYRFIQNGDFKDVNIFFDEDKNQITRMLSLEDKEEAIIAEVSEENARLQILLKYPGMKTYFKENKYATSFKPSDYILSPIIYQNIYKGALGEVAGKFILENELNVTLKSINDPSKFEFFDFELAKDIYIDFKHWKFRHHKSRTVVLEDIKRKMNEIGAKRVYIINVVRDTDYKIAEQIGSNIIEIPRLIDENGNIDTTALKAIKMEDLIANDKNE